MHKHIAGSSDLSWLHTFADMPLNEVLNFADRVALGFADEGQTRKVGKVSSTTSTTVPLLLHGKYKRIKVSFEHSLVLQNFTDNVAIGQSSRC